jgi:hypothetical protein
MFFLSSYFDPYFARIVIIVLGTASLERHGLACHRIAMAGPTLCLPVACFEYATSLKFDSPASACRRGYSDHSLHRTASLTANEAAAHQTILCGSLSGTKAGGLRDGQTVDNVPSPTTILPGELRPIRHDCSEDIRAR